MEKKTKTMAGLMVTASIAVAVMIFAGLTAEAKLQPVHVFSGTGPKVIRRVPLEKGAAIFRMTHDGQLFKLWLLDRVGNPIELIACELGEYDGVRGVSIEKKGDYMLQISAGGRWTITIEQPI